MSNIFLAASDLTIHTYGGGLILQKVFTAISMLSSESGIVGPMMFVCAALGFGFVFCKLVATQGFESFLSHYLFPFFAIYTAFIIPTTTVHIEDELSRPLIYKVDHVPRLLAHFAEIASSIGFYATTCIEKAMHTVDDTKYSQTGLIFGADTALDFRRFQLTNPNLQKDLREFSKQCVLYDLALGRYSLDDLKKSTDLWDFLKKKTSKLGMIYYCPPGSKQCQYLSCQKAIEEFEPLFNKEKAYYAKQEIGKNLPLTFQALTKIKQDSEKLISQQLMMNVLSDQFSGEKFAEQRAYVQQNTTYQTTGFLASKGVVVMRCVFEAIIYVAFLFILPLAILPSGIKLLLNWVWLVIWIQFWPPFYAILNYIASIITDATTAGIQEGVANKGLSIFTSIGLQNFSNDTAALAGYLTLSVPYLSYIILQGGVQQFVQLAGTLTSPTQSAASSAANEQTSGNYSYDNISVGQHSAGNTTAFQTNVAPSVSAGHFTENKGYERTDYTTQGAIYTQNVSNPASSINADQVFGESLQHQKQYAESNVETTSKNYQESLAYATNAGSNLVNHMAHSESYSKNISDREAYDTQQAVRRMESAADNWGKQYGLSSKESLDIAFAGSFGGEVGVSKLLSSIVGVGASLSGKGSLSYNTGADTSKLINSALNFAQSTEFQENYQKVKDYAISQASSSSTDEGVRFAQDFSQSLNGIQTNQEAFNAAKTELNQVSDTSSWYQQNSHMIKDNLNQKYMDWAVDRYNEKYGDGTGLARLKEIMNSSDSSASSETQSLIYEFMQSEMGKQTHITTPSNYQNPQTAYESLTVPEVDQKRSLDSVSASYSTGSELIEQVYGANLGKQEELQKGFSEAAGKQDSYAYFTRNNIKYDRNYAINQFDIQKQRPMFYRAWENEPREETVSDYQISVAPFWTRGEE
jgi:conjugal transfer mating pair stabilization protein TraG